MGEYAAAGQQGINVPDEVPPWFEYARVYNLAWSTAAKPLPDVDVLTWTYGSTDETNPSSEMGAETVDPGMVNQQATIAGGNSMFVAATYKRNVLTVDFGGSVRQIPVKTAAVAHSLDGINWTNHVLTGVQEGMREPSVESSKDKRGDSKTFGRRFRAGQR